MRPIIITTPRFLLRLYDSHDIEHLVALYSDPEVMQFYPREYSREKAIKHVSVFNEQYEKTGYTMWAVERRSNGEFVGRVGLWPLDHTDEVEIGYIVAKDHWGNGIATEAAEACLSYAFKNLKMDYVAAIAVPNNYGSLRVMDKLGFEFIREDHFYDSDVLYHRLEADVFHHQN